MILCSLEDRHNCKLFAENRCALTIGSISDLFMVVSYGVGIATGYGLDNPRSITGSSRFFSSPQSPNRL
jgi:hypothetical protein